MVDLLVDALSQFEKLKITSISEHMYFFIDCSNIFWVIDSEPGKWKNMVFFCKKVTFFEFFEKLYDTCSPKVIFFVEKRPLRAC